MRKSAEYFLAGFFGLEWVSPDSDPVRRICQSNAEIVDSKIMPHWNSSLKCMHSASDAARFGKSYNIMCGENGTCGFNNSLSGNSFCPNYYNFRDLGGENATAAWQEIYLVDAHQRVQSRVHNFNFTISDIYDLQSLCAYETVCLGYSQFCRLFTYEEWEGYEYGTDLEVFGGNGFGSAVGRAVETGWVEEFKARLEGHLLTKSVIPLVLDKMVFGS